MKFQADTSQVSLIQVHGNKAIELEFAYDDGKKISFFMSAHIAREFAEAILAIYESAANNAQIEGAAVDSSYKKL